MGEEEFQLEDISGLPYRDPPRRLTSGIRLLDIPQFQRFVVMEAVAFGFIALILAVAALPGVGLDYVSDTVDGSFSGWAILLGWLFLATVYFPLYFRPIRSVRCIRKGDFLYVAVKTNKVYPCNRHWAEIYVKEHGGDELTLLVKKEALTEKERDGAARLYILKTHGGHGEKRIVIPHCRLR